MENKELKNEENQEQKDLNQEVESSTEEAGLEKNTDELTKLQNEYQKNTAELAELKDKYVRLYADFDNFRKRVAREKLDLMNNASENVLKTLLPVVDDFDRSTKAQELAEADTTIMSEGFVMIYNKLRLILQQQGVKEMESTGSAFNPDLHEAIAEVPAGEDMKGKIVDTVTKGYYLNEKIIRYAKVVVGK